MKFIGEPNQLVKERKRKPFSTEFSYKPLIRFDNNGYYSTDDINIINKLKKKFKYEEVIQDVQRNTSTDIKKTRKK